MKGDPRLIESLNARLASEHAGIVQYITHSAMVENWGYERLTNYIKARAIEEMKHAGMLLDRILFLEGVPTLIKVGTVEIADNVGEMFLFDQKREVEAIVGYTESIDLAEECKDFATRKLLEMIIESENEHENIIEANISQILQSGIENYLPVQIKD